MRAVLFDYGEVLCTADPAAHRQLLTLTGLDNETFERLYWRDRHDYDLGILDGRSYWDKFSRDAALNFTPEKIDALIENDVLMWTSNLIEPMLDWAAALQDAGLFTAILSNMGPDVLRTMRQEFAWLAHFNHLTWSCELGIAKPDPVIYTLTCEALGVRPNEGLFLDDKLPNIRGAENVGLHAIQFSNIAQLRQDLESRGLLTELPDPVPA
jgi:putative hydrolase of the HAD superfamily